MSAASVSTTSSSSGPASGPKKFCAELLNELDELIKTDQSTSVATMPKELRDKLLKGQAEGCVRFRCEIKTATGWKTAGKRKLDHSGKKNCLRNSKRRVLGEVALCKKLHEQLQAQKLANEARLAKLNEQAAKAKSELLKLKKQTADTLNDIDLCSDQQEILEKSIEARMLYTETVDVKEQNNELIAAVKKLTKDNAQVFLEVEALKAKVAAESLMTLK